MDRLAAVGKVDRSRNFLVLAGLEVLSIPMFYLAAFVGEYAGRYRIEDYTHMG
jgi:hypothetical protein